MENHRQRVAAWGSLEAGKAIPQTVLLPMLLRTNHPTKTEVEMSGWGLARLL